MAPLIPRRGIIFITFVCLFISSVFLDIFQKSRLWMLRVNKLLTIKIPDWINLLDSHKFKLYMDITTNNNDILMRLINNALY